LGDIVVRARGRNPHKRSKISDQELQCLDPEDDHYCALANDNETFRAFLEAEMEHPENGPRPDSFHERYKHLVQRRQPPISFPFLRRDASVVFSSLIEQNNDDLLAP
jgi:hypothetical protein